MGGKRGYGPTHSQSIEKHFLGLPDTMMIALHSRIDPGLIYYWLFETIDRPTIVIENKLLYGMRLREKIAPGFVLEHTDERFPTTRLRPEVMLHLTMLCYGGMLPETERVADQLFEEHEIVAEVISSCAALSVEILSTHHGIGSTERSASHRGRRTASAGFQRRGSRRVRQNAPGVLQKVCRLASKGHPIPASREMENEALPTTQSIVATAAEFVKTG